MQTRPRYQAAIGLRAGYPWFTAVAAAAIDLRVYCGRTIRRHPDGRFGGSAASPSGGSPCADRNGSSELLSAQARVVQPAGTRRTFGLERFRYCAQVRLRLDPVHGSDRYVAFPDPVLRDRICRRDGLEAIWARCLRIAYLNGVQGRIAEASMAPVRVPSAMSEGDNRATAARPWSISVGHDRKGTGVFFGRYWVGSIERRDGIGRSSGLRAPYRNEVRFVAVGRSEQGDASGNWLGRRFGVTPAIPPGKPGSEGLSRGSWGTRKVVQRHGNFVCIGLRLRTMPDALVQSVRGALPG